MAAWPMWSRLVKVGFVIDEQDQIKRADAAIATATVSRVLVE